MPLLKCTREHNFVNNNDNLWAKVTKDRKKMATVVLWGSNARVDLFLFKCPGMKHLWEGDKNVLELGCGDGCATP